METLRVLILALWLLVISGCGVSQKFLLSQGKGLTNGGANPVSPGEGTFLKGILPVAGGEAINLASLKAKPLVLIFASDTCEICLAESLAIRKTLLNANKEPDQIRILTAIVAAGSNDALAWKNENKIPWAVGWDQELSLFNEWCGGGSVPCTVVQSPDRGIVLKHKGELSVEEIRKITGPWEKS